MQMDCENAHEHLDAWALGALDAHEARGLESHIAGCAACAQLADEAREHAAMIGVAAPSRAASATLKARVMASARALTDIRRQGVSRRWRTGAAAAAAIAVAAIAWGTVTQLHARDLEHGKALLAAGATEQSKELEAVQTEVVEVRFESADLNRKVVAQNAVLDVALLRDVEWTNLDGTAKAPGATGRCVWSKTQALGAFIADNLPRPPVGKAYNMWLVYENGSWVNGGSFQVDEEGRGHLVMHKIWGDRAAGKLMAFAVTVENAMVAPGPSPEQLVLASTPQ